MQHSLDEENNNFQGVLISLSTSYWHICRYLIYEAPVCLMLVSSAQFICLAWNLPKVWSNFHTSKHKKRSHIRLSIPFLTIISKSL